MALDPGSVIATTISSSVTLGKWFNLLYLDFPSVKWGDKKNSISLRVVAGSQ